MLSLDKRISILRNAVLTYPELLNCCLIRQEYPSIIFNLKKVKKTFTELSFLDSSNFDFFVCFLQQICAWDTRKEIYGDNHDFASLGRELCYDGLTCSVFNTTFKITDDFISFRRALSSNDFLNSKYVCQHIIESKYDDSCLNCNLWMAFNQGLNNYQKPSKRSQRAMVFHQENKQKIFLIFSLGKIKYLQSKNLLKVI